MRISFVSMIVCLALFGAGRAVAQPSSDTAAAVQPAPAATPPLRDPGLVTPADSVAKPPQVDVANPPDPISSPGGAWDSVLAWSKRARWMGIALAMLILATAYRKRMQPSPDEPLATGWRAMSITIASAVVAVAGPLVEFGMGTGGWTAVMMGVGLAVGLIVDRKDPPKGAAVKV